MVDDETLPRWAIGQSVLIFGITLRYFQLSVVDRIPESQVFTCLAKTVSEREYAIRFIPALRAWTWLSSLPVPCCAVRCRPTRSCSQSGPKPPCCVCSKGLQMTLSTSRFSSTWRRGASGITPRGVSPISGATDRFSSLGHRCCFLAHCLRSLALDCDVDDIYWCMVHDKSYGQGGAHMMPLAPRPCLERLRLRVLQARRS